MATSPFNFTSQSSQKLHFSYSPLTQSKISLHQPPTRKQPWRTIQSIPLLRDLRIVVPSRLSQILSDDHLRNQTARLASTLPACKYFKVVLTLSELLAIPALWQRDYAMLSASPSDSNGTVILLDHGTMKLTLPRRLYESTGLAIPTEKIASGARKHDVRSERVRVSVELRKLSLTKSKAWNRLVWASKSVDGLREARVWVCCDASILKSRKRERSGESSDQAGVDEDSKAEVDEIEIGHTQTQSEGTEFNKARQGTAENAVDASDVLETNPSESYSRHPLAKHHPTIIKNQPRIHANTTIVPAEISSPSLFNMVSNHDTTSTSRDNVPEILDEDIFNIAERLSMLFLSGISPSFPQAEDDGDVEGIAVLQWTGVIHCRFVLEMVIDSLGRAQEQSNGNAGKLWMGIQGAALGNEKGESDGYMILLQGDEKQGGQSTQEERRAGFGYATVFEYVDSMP